VNLEKIWISDLRWTFKYNFWFGFEKQKYCTKIWPKIRKFHWAAITRVIRNLVGWENCSTSGYDQTRLHIHQNGRRQITKRGTVFLYFQDNFLLTDKVSDGKAGL